MVFTSLAFATVFSVIFKQSLADNLPYIMGGIMTYNMIASVLTEGPEIYLSNAGIISNHAYPFTYYNFEWSFKQLLLFFHNVVVFEIIQTILLASAHKAIPIPHWSIVIGLAVVVFNIFCWGGLVCLVAARYRDLRFLLPYMSQLLMFLTPVTYQVSLVKGSLLLTLNPIYPFVQMVRAPLMGSAMPLDLWPMALAVSVVGFLLWFTFFSIFRKRIAFWV